MGDPQTSVGGGGINKEANPARFVPQEELITDYKHKQELPEGERPWCNAYISIV